MLKKFEAGHEKSSLRFIPCMIFVLKTTSMYFDLTYYYYYYYTKLNFFSGCTHKKTEMIDPQKLIILVWHVHRAVYLELQAFPILTQLPIHHHKSFHQLLLNQGHHHNIHFNTTLFHIHFDWSFRSFVLKRFCWFIPSFSFLSCVSIFYTFSFITHSK